MKWKMFFDTYFLLSKRERNGILALLVLIGLLVVIRILIPVFFQQEGIQHEDKKQLIAQLEKTLDSIEMANRKANKPKRWDNKTENFRTNQISKLEDEVPIQYFTFDPNLVEAKDMKALGFNERNIATIVNYRNKGGKFKKATDLFAIYGIDSVLVAKLIPYVEFEKNVIPDVPVAKLDLNRADTTALKSLPGIGSVLAKRICDYRNALGGFYSLAQLNEVYKLPPETIEKILPFLEVDASVIKKTNINFASVDELKKHPYLNYYQSRKIVDLRAKSGSFQSLDFMANDTSFSANYTKLKEYFTVQ